MRCKAKKQLQCRTINFSSKCSHTLITAPNAPKYMLTSTIQFGKGNISDKSDKTEEKKKGEDYVNNIGKLFRSLHLSQLSCTIEKQIQIIDSNRSLCTATEVEGNDENMENYSQWASSFKEIIDKIFIVLYDTNFKYIKTQLKDLLPKLNTTIAKLPEVCIDKRVIKKLGSSTYTDEIDKAVMTISKCFYDDFAIFINSIKPVELGNGRKQYRPINNCLIDAIANAAGIVPNNEQYIRIRQNLSARYSLHEMLDFDPFVLGIITQEFRLNNHIIVVNTQRAYFNNVVYIGEDTVNQLIKVNQQQPILYITHNYLHFAAQNSSV